MYVQVDRLMQLLDYLSEALQASKEKGNVKIEQVLKADDINLAENAQLNIQQNQYIIIYQADKWIEEAKQITSELLKIMPTSVNSLPDVVRTFKREIVKKAIEAEGGNKTRAAKRIGLKRQNLNYFAKY